MDARSRELKIVNESGPPIVWPTRANGVLLLQLRQEVRVIKVLSVRLNFSVRVDLKDADAVHEEDVSSLGLET